MKAKNNSAKPATEELPAIKFEGLIKARTTKEAELDFTLIARRDGKKVPEVARQVFNDFIAADKGTNPEFWKGREPKAKAA